MARVFIAAAATCSALLVPVTGNSNDNPFREANLAWERGEYISALTIYRGLLESADAERVFEAIALQTGELYRTLELTSDGASPQFSPDGRLIAYETGPPLAKKIRIAPTDAPLEPIAELPGRGAAFSPDSSKLAYLRLAQPSERLRDAQAAADKASRRERQQKQAELNRLLAAESQLVVRALSGGSEIVVDTGSIGRTAVRLGAGDTMVFSGIAADGLSQLFLVRNGGAPEPLTKDDREKTLGNVNGDGSAVLFTLRARSGRGGRGGARQGEDHEGRGEAEADRARSGEQGGDEDRDSRETTPEGRGGAREGTGTFGVISLPEGRIRTAAGSAPSLSHDGKSLAFVLRQGHELQLMAGPASDPSLSEVVRRGAERIDAPAFTPDGSRIAFQLMAREDWELSAVGRDGKSEVRLTREIQHDLLPRFLSSDRVLAVMGEARHRRSYLYDSNTGARTRLFHNNTVRTIAPEYAWVPDPSGTRILIVAERDGDTVSPRRGVYLVDLSRKITLDDLKRRVDSNLQAERALRAKGERLFAPMAADVRKVVEQVSVDRVYDYEATLYAFDSKHITRPGNALASEYLYETYKSFGYEPEYQWFSPRNALGGKTANVLATLKGTVNPELIYVVSSHYDSVAGGPGADDDSSGTAALLETARVMAAHPQPATIVFASFTGEEARLLGSREFVRQAVEKKLKIVGALNNDMVGWANDQRLDNTIRYSNPGIRDIQHGAAMHFTNLITYDALYYKSTDAAAYFEAYGDIVGGIGSYPVLANPHYHQSHDVLETINHRLVTEVAKTTAATLMLLASSPSRLTELKAERSGRDVHVSWKPSPESGVTGYIVTYGPPESPESKQLRVANPSATLTGIVPGTAIAVTAVNARGLESWDAARISIE